jgi:hypothetical protein
MSGFQLCPAALVRLGACHRMVGQPRREFAIEEINGPIHRRAGGGAVSLKPIRV